MTDRFRGIEFRDTPEGRFAFLSETRLAVHFVKQVASDFGQDTKKVAEHFRMPLWRVESALGYAEAFREEIEKASVRAQELESFEALSAKLPNIERVDLQND